MASKLDNKDNPYIRLYLSPEGSDVSIICGDSIFPAHKKVLVNQSGYFRCACHGKWKILVEEKKNIVLNEDQPVLIRKMLQFLYTGSYTVDTYGLTIPDLPNERPNTMVKADYPDRGDYPDEDIYTPCFHAMLYAVAVFYEIPKLEEETIKNFRQSLWQIREKEGFQAAVIEVYYATNPSERKLRDCLVEMVIRHLEFFYRKGNEPQILDHEILDYVPEFCRDLCIASMMANRRFESDLFQYGCAHVQMKEKVARVGRENSALRAELRQYKKNAEECDE
ncbi:BTB/POZ domain-containing protein [Aspergillus ibericus CBS 121593]|uniref:BTB domain-containing protein n=1 Tax=Aspergillus ibericus CBS 121593 TaxID=1448316 RepID=A0A395H0V0_9EURO|nr:hypothetical protein BO80DRAFT_434376 [Aspergillus ibericus CBS 121593]RAL01446.1 hypothetical protein BO80DRAFT_434376 [Aspergillus ibericus CBS 121593]